MTQGEAFVTLATNDQYSLGALVLAHSLRNAGTTRSLAILITPGVSTSMRNQLSSVYDVVKLVDVMDSQDETNLALLARPELGITLTKIHAWNLTQFNKAVFLDADCLVVQNCDELFEREELSAVSDIGWPDCFNSGVFVFRPSAETYQKLIDHAKTEGSFDGGDQGLLNSFFSDWATKDIKNHLSFIYNMVATVIYSYAPAYKRFGQNVKIVHFLGAIKPWSSASSPTPLGQYLQLWWSIFESKVQGGLEPALANLVSQVGKLHLGAHLQQQQQGQQYGGQKRDTHQSDWEAGNIDYMGADSFENIQRRIQETVQKKTPQVQGPAAVQGTAQVTGQAHQQGQIHASSQAAVSSHAVQQSGGVAAASQPMPEREPSPVLSYGMHARDRTHIPGEQAIPHPAGQQAPGQKERTPPVQQQQQQAQPHPAAHPVAQKERSPPAQQQQQQQGHPQQQQSAQSQQGHPQQQHPTQAHPQQQPAQAQQQQAQPGQTGAQKERSPSAQQQQQGHPQQQHPAQAHQQQAQPGQTGAAKERTPPVQQQSSQQGHPAVPPTQSHPQPTQSRPAAQPAQVNPAGQQSQAGAAGQKEKTPPVQAQQGKAQPGAPGQQVPPKK